MESNKLIKEQFYYREEDYPEVAALLNNCSERKKSGIIRDSLVLYSILLQGRNAGSVTIRQLMSEITQGNGIPAPAISQPIAAQIPSHRIESQKKQEQAGQEKDRTPIAATPEASLTKQPTPPTPLDGGVPDENQSTANHSFITSIAAQC